MLKPDAYRKLDESTRMTTYRKESKAAGLFKQNFDEKSFWSKLTRCAKVAGREVIEKALILYYTLQDPDVPAWAKTVVVNALAYFINPVDTIPDPVPGVGYADDLVVLVTALAVIAVCVSPETRAAAKAKAREWFPG